MEQQVLNITLQVAKKFEYPKKVNTHVLLIHIYKNIKNTHLSPQKKLETTF